MAETRTDEVRFVAPPEVRGTLKLNDPEEQVPMVFTVEGEEVFRITPEREMVFADGVTPEDAAERFADWWNEHMESALSTPREPEVDDDTVQGLVDMAVNLTHERDGLVFLLRSCRRHMKKHEDQYPRSFMMALGMAVDQRRTDGVKDALGVAPSPYTDEDGRERCHLGGCRVEPVSGDEGTCYYRVVGDGDE